MSPDDEDTATEVSEGYGGTGPSVGQGTDDTGASQEFSGPEGIDDANFSDAMEEALGLYGASAIGLGMNQAEFNAATGRTSFNPHPDSFLSQLLGVNNVDYTAQYGGPEGVAEMNAIALDVYNNPVDKDGNVRGAVGQDTAFGQIKQIDRKQGPLETLARTGFGLMGLGPLTSFLGTTQKSIAPIGGIEVPGGVVGAGFNYDPTLDPSNQQAYQGPQSMLGQFARGIERTVFGGAQPVTETAKGIGSFFDTKEEKEEKEEKEKEEKSTTFGMTNKDLSPSRTKSTGIVNTKNFRFDDDEENEINSVMKKDEDKNQKTSILRGDDIVGVPFPFLRKRLS